MTAVVGYGIVLELLHHHHAIPLAQRQPQASQQAVLILGRDGQLIRLHLYTMDLVAVELHPVGQLTQLAVDAHGEVALLAQLLEELLIVTLTLLDHGCQEEYPLALVALQEQL